MSNPVLSRLAWIALLVSLTGCFGGAPQKPLPQTQARAESLLMRAVRAEQRGDVREAEKLLRESLGVSSSIDDAPAKAKALVNLARLFRLGREPSKAAEAIDAALEILEPEAAFHAEACQEKALVELSSGKAAAALPWAERAVVKERGGLLGRRLNLLGRIQLARGDMTAAAAALKKALDENRRSGHAEEEANSLRMLGIIARTGNEVAESERLLSEALEIDKRIGASVKIATDLEELALTARRGGNLEKTALYLERACDVHLNGGRMLPAVADLTALAELFAQLGNARKAETTRNKAQQIAEQQTPHQPGTSPVTTKPSSSP